MIRLDLCNVGVLVVFMTDVDLNAIYRSESGTKDGNGLFKNGS